MEPRTVKVGDKGRHVRIPFGWSRVTDGAVQARDLFLECPDYKAWLPVDGEDVGESVMEYDCVIRREK